MKAILGRFWRDRLGSNLIAAVIFVGISVGYSQGMPPEVRNNIHTLFDSHEKVSRTVRLTTDGYISVTESSDPNVAETLKKHVKQMQARLGRGAFIRRWDPAFSELVEHYSELSHEVKLTEKGLKVVVVGKTPEAVKIAQNHAKIISRFAAKGWAEHDVRHPRAVDTDSDLTSAEPEGEGEGCGKSCCLGKEAAEKPKCDATAPRTCCMANTESLEKK